MASKPETVFRKRVRRDLTAIMESGLPLWFEAVQQKAIKGSPDYFLCANGHFITLELKSEDGILSAIQEAKMNAIGNANGLALLADPETWETVKKTIMFYLEEDKNDCIGTHEIPEEVRAHAEETLEAP